MRNLYRLSKLDLKACSKLEVAITSINLESLEDLDLSDCSLLKSYLETSTDIEDLKPNGTAIKEVSSSMRSWPLLLNMEISHCEIQELGPWVGRISRLRRLVLRGMQKLVSLPQLPYSLTYLDAENCESLERLDCSFGNPGIRLNFINCFKLNQEARDLIIHTPTTDCAILPGGKVPACFTYRASGSSLILKLNQKPLRTSTKFRACILLANKDEHDSGYKGGVYVDCSITSKQNAHTACTTKSSRLLKPLLQEHLYTFEVMAVKVTSTELLFEFKLLNWLFQKTWEIKECGILHILDDPSCDEDSEVKHYDGDEDSDESSETSIET